MKEIKDIRDLRIGDTVQLKQTKFPMQVVGIFQFLHASQKEACIYLDFEGNKGDIWEASLSDIEGA